MAIDYREVLKDLREQEKLIEQRLGYVRDAIEAFDFMLKESAPMPEAAPLRPPVAQLPFRNMGTREAIVHLLSKASVALMPSDITKILADGGIQTRATDFAATVGSTLNQMKADGIVERKETGWVKANRGSSSNEQQQPSLQ